MLGNGVFLSLFGDFLSFLDFMSMLRFSMDDFMSSTIFCAAFTTSSVMSVSLTAVEASLIGEAASLSFPLKKLLKNESKNKW